MPDTATEEGTDETTEEPNEEGLLEQADGDGEPTEDDPEGTDTDSTDEGTEETEVYEPAGELTQEQVESLPDHMVNDDGTVDAEQLLKQNLGFREKQSDGTLEEALELYEEYGDKVEELEQDDVEDEDEPEEPKVNVPESPDEYEITIEDDEGNEMEVDEDIKPILQKAAHDAELSQEQINQFANQFEKEFNENFTRSLDPDEELSKISDDPQEAQKVVNEVNQRVKNMHERGFLTEEEFNEAIIMGGTAEGVSVLRKMMAKMNEFEEIPADTESVGGESVSDVQSELNEVMNHEGYMDPSHPEHQELNKRADQLREKKRELQNN